MGTKKWKKTNTERIREITWIFTCLNFRRKNGSFVKLTKENVIGTSIFSIFKSRKNTCNSISRTLFRFPFATTNIFRWVFFSFIRIYFDETWFNDRKKKKQNRMNLKRLYSKEFRYFEIESNENSNGKIWFASYRVFAYLIKTNGKHHLDTCKHSIIMVIDTKMKIACKLLSTVVILVCSFICLRCRYVYGMLRRGIYVDGRIVDASLRLFFMTILAMVHFIWCSYFVWFVWSVK